MSTQAERSRHNLATAISGVGLEQAVLIKSLEMDGRQRACSTIAKSMARRLDRAAADVYKPTYARSFAVSPDSIFFALGADDKAPANIQPVVGTVYREAVTAPAACPTS